MSDIHQGELGTDYQVGLGTGHQVGLGTYHQVGLGTDHQMPFKNQGPALIMGWGHDFTGGHKILDSFCRGHGIVISSYRESWNYDSLD